MAFSVRIMGFAKELRCFTTLDISTETLNNLLWVGT